MKSAYEAIKTSVNKGTFESVKKQIADNGDEYVIRDIVLPSGGKQYFLQCASVLSALPIDPIKNIAQNMKHWFEDLNWPGVDLIEIKLRQLEDADLCAAVNWAREEAVRTNDEEWLCNLDEILGR